ncbi:MAG: hypothetical protein E6J34_21910 [Chloroflexi bacterium]|nr:MAG: hypothetical protein E6J34_21910 [Chloroflexota bacterium]
MSIIPGPWSTILGAAFTVISTVLGLLQWHAQSSPEVISPSLHPLDQQALSVYLTEIPLGITKRKGALIVKVKKKYLGVTLRLCRGFGPPSLATEVVSNIIERQIDGSSMFIGIFPKLEPGNYTVYLHDPTKGAPVTIHSGQPSEIDWRYRDIDSEKL